MQDSTTPQTAQPAETTDIPERDRLGDDEFVQDPYALYERLRSEHGVHPVELPRGLRVWLVSRYADARAALADPLLSKDFRDVDDLFEANGTDRESRLAGGAALSGHMLNTDPPDHERLRRLVNKAFTSRRIEQLRPRIEEITAELLDAMAGKGEVDLLDDFAFPLPITVICELLGVPVADRDDFRVWSNTLIAGGAAGDMADSAVAMVGYLRRLIDAKRAEPGEDMYSALVGVHDEGDRLTEDELVAMGFLLLVAGHETTVNLIANGTLALLRNPDQLAALRADPALLRGAVEEFLRYDGPVKNATLRYTTRPTRIGDVVVPPRQFVVVSLAGGNRDPERYAEPNTFDVTRDTSGHLAFGHGIHYCLGAPLARLEAEIAIGGLLHRFDRVELATPETALRWRPGMIIRGLERLPVRLSRSEVGTGV